MKLQDDDLDTVRRDLSPSPEVVSRVKAKIRRTLADDRQTRHALKDLPSPGQSAFFRVRRRLFHSLEGGVGEDAETSPWNWTVALAAAAAAVLVFALVRAPLAPSRSLRPIEGPSVVAVPTEAAPAFADSDTRRSPAPRATRAPNRPGPKPDRKPAGGDSRDRGSAGANDASGIYAMRTFGQTNPEIVEEVLASLKTKIDECYRKSGATQPLSISLAVEANGAPQGVAVVGKPPGAERFKACAQPFLMQASFGQGEVLRAGPEEDISGGVIRFRIGGGEQ